MALCGENGFIFCEQHARKEKINASHIQNQVKNYLSENCNEKYIAYFQNYSNTCANADDFYFTSPTPPTLNSTTVWGNAGGYKIFVPFSSVNAYRTATNWTAQSSVMRGFSEAGAFEPGYKLPKYNVEGYELTWYSDSALTVPATMVEDSSAIYYCTAGTQKVAYGIKSITALDCTISITDGDTNYHLGYGVPSGTLLTIAGVPNIEGYVPYLFRVNGADFSSEDQITVDSDISIKAIYWDGITVPTNPTFGENTWDVIFRDFKAGTASRFWSVGDTKPITLTNGAVHTIRIADMQIGRYALSDGSGSSNGVLEFAECLDSVYKMHLTLLNTGGWAASEMKNAHMETIYSLLPADLKSAISEAVVLSNSGYSSYSITSSNNKLFLPSVYEIAGGSYDDREGSPQFDYYRLNNNAARIKYRGTSAAHWVTRSAATNGNSYYRITNIGSVDTVSSNSNISVSPCFAV